MMLRIFRSLAILEGISYLLLFAIGMPLKHWGEIPTPNIYLGYTHGFLFLTYLVFAVLITTEHALGFKKFLWMLAASLLPFGTFYLEQHYLRHLGAACRQGGTK